MLVTHPYSNKDGDRRRRRVFDHMAVGIIEGKFAGWSDHECAVLYDTVTDWTFGPIFENADVANEFLDYVRDRDLGNPRRLTDQELKDVYHTWLEVRKVKQVMEE